ncbi:hypothetical protein [Micropruina sp.]|uniref:hypothetical protein n=1 Tax=Micropruina sp. TaxID=2737536 RepID=UPI0039E2C719
MSAAIVPESTTTPPRTALVPPGRLGSWFSVLALPAWLSTFVALTLGYGVKSDVTGVVTPAQQAAYYQDNLAAAWVFALLSVVAILLLTLAPTLLGAAVWRLGQLRAPAAIAVVLGLTALVVELAGMADFIGLLTTPPDALPGWVAALAEPDTNTLLNGIGWGAIDLAVPLIGVVLWRIRVLGRIGLVVAIIGGAIFLVTVPFLFFQPMVPAALLLALGIPLLRRRM